MLETFEMNARYKRALDFIKKEIEVIKLQHEIRKETMERFNEMNRKVMLMEQVCSCSAFHNR
jgi:ATP-dependent Lon protease